MEQMTLKVVPEKADWVIQHCGCRYEIKYDTSRVGIHPPSWYVKRCQDGAFSKRYYSQPSGAFLALASGAIVWE